MNLTPKEKAKGLIEIYSKIIDVECVTDDLGVIIFIGFTKVIECALIAVEELIQESDVYRVDEFKNEERFNYWQEVKEELIKLKQ